MTKFARRLLIGVIFASGGLGFAAHSMGSGTPVSASGPLVAFLLPDNTTPRWTGQDAPDFKAALHRDDPAAQVIVDVANEDPSTQLAQAQAALTQGAKVLVVVAVDENQAASIVRAAHRAHAVVIAYTRLISNSPVDYMVGDNPHQIGVVLGKWVKAHTKKGATIAVINGSAADSFAHQEHGGYFSVLKPLFRSGARHLVGNVWTPEWDPTKAHAEADALLVQTHGKIQAVLSGNDGMAAGIIAALSTHGLAGKVPVTGIDATLASDQLILKGEQSMSVWRSISTEANYTARVVDDVLHNRTPPKSFFNGSAYNGQVHVPLKAVPSIVIDTHNMYILIKNHVYTRAELCAGIHRRVGPCH